MRATVEERFWAKVDKNGPVPESRPDLGNCWLWVSGKNERRYGRFYIDGHNSPAHRVAYEMFNGAMADDLVTDHLCRNPPCVNPVHLEAVTGKVNTLRGVGPSAINAVKTECKYGHPFIPSNINRQKGGKRHCRQCHRDTNKRANAKRYAGKRDAINATIEEFNSFWQKASSYQEVCRRFGITLDAAYRRAKQARGRGADLKQLSRRKAVQAVIESRGKKQ